MVTVISRVIAIDMVDSKLEMAKTFGATDTVNGSNGDAVEQVRELTGSPPLGYYAGLPSLNTRKLVAEAGCFQYDSDVYNDDLPYWSPDYPELLPIP